MASPEEPLDTFRTSGRLEWIGMASASRQPLASVPEAALEVGTGLAGEHHARSGGSKRQVTLIQQEHLPVIASLAGREAVTPELLRRNLVVSGLALQAVKKRRFRIGDVLFEGTGDCHPCGRMEENLGAGGLNAMAGHGGITARVLEGGRIRVGDELHPVIEGVDAEPPS